MSPDPFRASSLPLSFAAATLALLLGGCGDPPGSAQPETDQITPARAPAGEGPTTAPGGVEPMDSTVASPSMPADEFLARIAEHCGDSFEGRIITNEPAQDEDPFVGQRLVMHVRECSEQEVRIPFHVGDNHSRTWILTRTPSGLRLKHDHRLEDGTDDPLTMYGGESTDAGTATRQEFPVGQHSIDMFNRLGYEASVENTWAMEIEPGERFLYELSRPSGRMFQVEFDLGTEVPTPPTPWGYVEQ